MKLSLTFYHFEEMQKNGYNMDMLFLLKLINEGEEDVKSLCEGSPKLEALYQGMMRKGLVSDAGALTTMGTELIVFSASKAKQKIVKKTKSIATEFESWWLTYPGTDTFVHKGKTFTGARSLRQNKEECRLKFDKILLEGEYKTEDLISALKLDVHQKKEASVKQNANKLTYMQNSLTYLNQRSFEPFIELIKQGIKVEESPQMAGGTDV